jgi:hypothetical protein
MYASMQLAPGIFPRGASPSDPRMYVSTSGQCTFVGRYSRLGENWMSGGGSRKWEGLRHVILDLAVFQLVFGDCLLTYRCGKCTWRGFDRGIGLAGQRTKQA